MRILRKLFTPLLLLLSGCERYSLDDYKANRPTISIPAFFNGPMEGWGMFQDYSGKVTRHFTMKAEGHWKGNKGEFQEFFTWNDGTTSQRVWTLEAISDDNVIATISDGVGQATGRAAGNAIQWSYSLKIPVNDSEYTFDFEDWMFALDEHTILNKAKMKKFGFTVGQVTVFLKKGT